MVKLPQPPPILPDEPSPEVHLLERDTVVWRLTKASGRHTIGWNELRHYGPLAGMRFDPHEPPASMKAEGVAYVARDLATTLAEVYQTNRVINRTRLDPVLTGFRFTRNLRLIDLRSSFPLRMGASHAIGSGRKDHCQAWARLLRRTWPRLDGLVHASAMTGADCVTLFNPARSAFPAAASFSEPLAHPGLNDALGKVAASIGYTLL